MSLVPCSLPLGMPRISLLVWGVGEGGKKYTYEGQNQHKAGEIVRHLEIHSAVKLLLLREAQCLYSGHQLFTL